VRAELLDQPVDVAVLAPPQDHRVPVPARDSARADLLVEQLQEALGYHAGRIMAVPKRKTSKSRRDKRRATHKIEAAKVNVCPTCHQPKRPHRVCPTCGTYKGREVEPLHSHAP